MVTPIKKLPDEVVSKIAAGEVVVNPASVVKELVENSIDAGATQLEIVIKNGGKTYIKVSDNGNGMSKDDLLLAVERYTTSKISDLEDIYNITSYGFRGEALASIGEVSRLVITTSDGESSHKLEMIGGKVVKVSETFRERGTTVEVFDLFYNIPARRKFLSSERVEKRMVTEVVERFLITKPSVAFLFKDEESVIYNAPSSSLESRFSLIFPEVKDFQTIENFVQNDIEINGIISSPQFFRKNRTGQVFFVNGRFVLDNMLHLSLERGYGEALIEGTHPYAVIFINLPPKEIDVNIHPQKLQIKFSDPRIVYDTLARCVRERLRSVQGYQIFIRNEEGTECTEKTSDFSQGNTNNLIFEKQTETYPKYFEKTFDIHEPNSRTVSQKDFERNSSYKGSELNNRKVLGAENYKSSTLENIFQPVVSSSFENVSNFTIVRNRYIIFEDRDGIVIMDFHAAHERIIYEELKSKDFERVPLLIPVELKFGKSMVYTLDSLSKDLNDNGFEFEKVSNEDGAKMIVKSVPSVIKLSQIQDVIMEVLEEYRVPFNKPKSLAHVLASKACKSAVKTGDNLSEEEVKVLVKTVLEKNLLTCPHGRPIMMKISFNQLDSYFGRR
ncbi:DNA mismatch repair endonuclease MutL [Fervidobacterium gondwanense]|uniref:DNA mismatch repair protein MutL n=1 Tax=Fervidobacterium gondwanense DSM 13020 TaxID=1121883 RepID=A0A1M7S0J4_FERGO|nr:DNA mismatch repair endonuclease MutL [Fervidobacterium gondwanense]SHN51950.1 DNA mismatch repair protein MutL [Fervidobacterium gondwanense DSM 13020]